MVTQEAGRDQVMHMAPGIATESQNQVFVSATVSAGGALHVSAAVSATAVSAGGALRPLHLGGDGDQGEDLMMAQSQEIQG